MKLSERTEIEKQDRESKLMIKTKELIHFIPLKLIVAIKASSNYSILYLTDGKKVTISKTLKSVESKLNEDFYRIHANCIIKLSEISIIHRHKKMVELFNGDQYNIARSRLSKFLLRIECDS